jgi:hypothetical protein
MDMKIEQVLSDFPFLSYGSLHENHYLGIIQNSDAQLLSMYVMDAIPDEDMRRRFLDLGQEWWWGSNRQIPINIFHGTIFRQFRPYLKHFNRKDFVLISGPAVSLQEAIARRVRKRQVTLVRNID